MDGGRGSTAELTRSCDGWGRPRLTQALGRELADAVASEHVEQGGPFQVRPRHLPLERFL